MNGPRQILAGKPLFHTGDVTYSNIMMVLAPLMNFLSGIAIDLYAPSMPSIAVYFHTSMMAVKNTITITMIGFAIGCLLCGVLLDTIGRRKVILTSLLIFIIASLLAPHCQSIYQLIAIRFVQGITTSVMSIGGRALVADHFSGHRFVVAMLYISLGYGLGPVIAPFIGGYLQYHFDWQANFYAYAICASAIFVFYFLFVHEKFNRPKHHTLLKVVTFYKTIVTQKTFFSGAMILGLVQLELIIYPTLGPFLVEHQLNYSSITYGNSALIVGLGYLSGALINRLLLRFFKQHQLINIGFIILSLSLLAQLVLALYIGLNLWTLVFPIVLIGFALGFLFGNILSNCLKLFPNNTGIASASQIFLLMSLGSLGVFAISYLKITSLYDLFFVFLGILILQLLIYMLLFKKNLPSTT